MTTNVINKHLLAFTKEEKFGFEENDRNEYKTDINIFI